MSGAASGSEHEGIAVRTRRTVEDEVAAIRLHHPCQSPAEYVPADVTTRCLPENSLHGWHPPGYILSIRGSPTLLVGVPKHQPVACRDVDRGMFRDKAFVSYILPDFLSPACLNHSHYTELIRSTVTAARQQCQ